jgi:hypothetical protein
VKISARDKKVLIIGIIVAAAVAVFYVATSLLPDNKDLTRQVEELRTRIRQQDEQKMRDPMYQNQIDQLNKRLEKDMTYLLPGDNPSVAGAELLKLLKDFAERSKVNITSRNNLPDKKMQGFTKVSARIETNCDIEQLVQFLAFIKNYEKYLKIEELMINSYRMPTQKKYEIRPGLTIAGYIHSRDEKPAEKPATPAKTVVR